MKYFWIAAAISTLAFAKDVTSASREIANDRVQLSASVMVGPEAVNQAVGADLGMGWVVARMKVAPKTEKPLPIGPDDFTMICRKDGQRTVAMLPGQIAGKGELVVRPSARQPGDEGTQTNGPIWGGVTASNKSGNQPPGLLDALKAKILPDTNSLQPVEGLLYFPIDGKVRPKDLAIIYQGAGGRLILEFDNPKK
ncbi:MAG: hypothetical protein ACRD30_03360 [Bryobacteraceae bacterium]